MSPVSNKIALFIDGANLYATAAAIPPSARPRASRVTTRRSSCSARPRGLHGAMTTTSMIERLALETRATGSMPIFVRKTTNQSSC